MHSLIPLCNNHLYHQWNYEHENCQNLMVGIAQVANSCITAAVLIANILIDSADLTSEISHGNFSRFLFPIISPFSAVWF